ncbi:MAG: GNAT family N-acetyltransferase [Solirubrobacteraceae bacterium]
MNLRAAEPEDAQAVLALLAARDTADLGAPDCTLADVRQEWASPRLHLAGDTVVAETAGQLAGYAVIRRPGTYAVVAPGHEGGGIGTSLRRWAEDHDRRHRRLYHRQLVARENRRGRAHLRTAGYRILRTYWRMAVALDVIPPVGETPDGVLLRRPDLGADAVGLHRLDAVSFGANADYELEPFDVFSAEHLVAHDLEPALSRVAVHDGRIIGFTLTRHREHARVGFIDLLAVHPDFRRRGVARSLLAQTFAACARAGLREAQLGVASDNPAALALYEQVGMSAQFGFDAFERPVSGRARGDASGVAHAGHQAA